MNSYNCTEETRQSRANERPLNEHSSNEHSSNEQTDFIDEQEITNLLAKAENPASATVLKVIEKARQMKGLNLAEAAILLAVDDEDLLQEMFAAAREVKDEIYGRRLVLFAPLYYSSYCVNNCLYCGFRQENSRPRRRLSLAEIERETLALEQQGHKRLLVIAGEESGSNAIDYLLEVIATIYRTSSGRGEIRRVNVEMAPMSTTDFARLKEARIGTYVLFQETYHRQTYQRMHPTGPKADYAYRLLAMDRAMEAGLGDVGIGALFGLYDYRFEVLALLQHAKHLETKFGVGPHTISVPRLEPASGAPLSFNPPNPVSDLQFKKIVAVLRLAVPYTGIILSTREAAALRTQLLDLGVSQMSAGSRTEPGGYGDRQNSIAQFSLGDERSLDEVIADISEHGYIPSFCTGCYRRGRVGQDFMELAKPGLIRLHCLPNALLTFAEYLHDYATASTAQKGFALIERELNESVPIIRRDSLRASLAQLAKGERDLYF